VNSKISIAVSVLSHTDRFEWLLEKATEFKVHQIFPIRFQKTKHVAFKMGSLNYILANASLKYKTQPPILHNVCSLENLFNLNSIPDKKFLAHYSEKQKDMLCRANEDCMLIIGPEDGFTEDEIKFCIKNNCNIVSLGDIKLRTEAAGMAGMCILNGVWDTIPNSILSA
jgi:16S rRNA (uracil1498-N3)-methyltransferase